MSSSSTASEAAAIQKVAIARTWGISRTTRVGLFYVRARYEDPVAGRFVSEDPAKSGANWTLYCRNQPATGGDCSGEDGPNAGDVGGFINQIAKFYNIQLPLGFRVTEEVVECLTLALIALSQANMGYGMAEVAFTLSGFVGATLGPAAGAFTAGVGVVAGVYGAVWAAVAYICIFNAACAVYLSLMDQGD